MPITFTINNSADVLQDGGTLRTDSFGGYSIVPTDLSDTFADKVTDVVSPVLEDQDTTFTDAINEYNGKVNDMYNFLGGETLVTNNLLDDIIDTSVENSPSITNYLNGKVDKGVAGAIWGLQVDSGTGVIAGMELGAMDDGVGNTLSSFKINADAFAVYNSSGSTMLDPDTGEDMPVFFIGQDEDGANFIGFNGKAIFENFIDKNGQTIIDGGTITTDLINVDEVVVGTNLVPINYGLFPQTIDGSTYQLPDSSYIAAMKSTLDTDGDPLLPWNASIKFGDSYKTSTKEFEYVFEVQGDGSNWKCVQDVADASAAAQAAAANNAAAARESAMADRLGYSNYSDMVNSARSNGKIIMEGGWLNATLIEADAIKADMIDVIDLFAQNITANGTITGATIQAGTIHTGSIMEGPEGLKAYAVATSYSTMGSVGTTNAIGGITTNGGTCLYASTAAGPNKISRQSSTVYVFITQGCWRDDAGTLTVKFELVANGVVHSLGSKGLYTGNYGFPLGTWGTSVTVNMPAGSSAYVRRTISSTGNYWSAQATTAVILVNNF